MGRLRGRWSFEAGGHARSQRSPSLVMGTLAPLQEEEGRRGVLVEELQVAKAMRAAHLMCAGTYAWISSASTAGVAPPLHAASNGGAVPGAAAAGVVDGRGGSAQPRAHEAQLGSGGEPHNADAAAAAGLAVLDGVEAAADASRTRRSCANRATEGMSMPVSSSTPPLLTAWKSTCVWISVGNERLRSSVCSSSRRACWSRCKVRGSGGLGPPDSAASISRISLSTASKSAACKHPVSCGARARTHGQSAQADVVAVWLASPLECTLPSQRRS